MTGHPADLAAQRSRRKQDLLLASALARQQAVVALGQVDQRVDRAVGMVRRVRGWMRASPLAPVAGIVATVGVVAALRRAHIFRLLRWGLIGWRIARFAADMREARRASG